MQEFWLGDGDEILHCCRVLFFFFPFVINFFLSSFKTLLVNLEDLWGSDLGGGTSPPSV